MPEIVITGDRGCVAKEVKLDDNSIVKYEVYLADDPYPHLVGTSNPDYRFVYKDIVEVSHKLSDIKVCEALFIQFNGAYGYPNGYTDRNMNIGDRIKITRGSITTWYEVGSFGWFELKNIVMNIK